MSDMYFENLPSTSTPITASNLNKLNDIKVSATTPITGEKVWFKQGKNLIKSFTPGLFYNRTNNTYETGTPFSTSSFIDVVVGETYVFSHALNSNGGHIACFDGNGNYLEALNDDTMLTPFTITNSNCKKILCISYDGNNNPSQNETWMQLEANSTATGYEPYIEKEIYIKNNNNVYESFINLNKDIALTTATRNSTAFSAGIIKYFKNGKIVTVSIMDLKSDSDITTYGTIIASGLPVPIEAVIFCLDRYTPDSSASSNCRVAINTSGNLVLHYDHFYSGEKQYYGQVTYLSL